MGGEAEVLSGNGIIRTPLRDLSVAIGVCTEFFPIDSLDYDFKTLDRSSKECFVADKSKFPSTTSSIEVEIWAVPERYKTSFEWNKPGISSDFLYKLAEVEPQIWIYAHASAF